MPQTNQSINALTSQQVEGFGRVALMSLVDRVKGDATVSQRVRLDLCSALQRRCEEWARNKPSDRIVKTLESISTKIDRGASYSRHICRDALVEVLIDRHPEADEAAKQWDEDPEAYGKLEMLVIDAVRKIL